ncbi:ActS/PrrB/RegB family redox-sensitive histidine kinase [Pelagibius litoralis]|uniref:histidine kinase n=1 Tax=Pelagibius litoralis TaxID=374515 RepID=A0A967C606_9PROT|nr:ActS/PrrB/RegB family redox-sensitive histidine kinase [Pelagibius litoralis]NIA68096.1 ActS/PrrB/RegB family redox-sensitive histidine kinase [Pelagibius litoralis]
MNETDAQIEAQAGAQTAAPAAAPAPGGRLRLRTLVAIRWIALLGQAITLAVVYFGLGYEILFVPAMAVIAFSGVLNVVLSVTRPSATWASDREAIWNLCFDVVQLAVLLGLTGGLQNPFAILVLAPVVVSAWALSRRSTLIISALALALVSVLAVWHLPLPWPNSGIQLSPVYIAGVWTALVIAVIFIASYVSSVAQENRQMSQALEATRLALAREQQLSALGGLAAAAAHELGTPLATIAVVARELQRELADDSPWRDDVELLHAESLRCRSILAGLAERPAWDDGSPYHRLPMVALVEAAAAAHQRDGVVLEIKAGPAIDSDATQPIVTRNAEVLHGLGTLMQNAMQFARHKVVVDLTWDEESVMLRIGDDGPGFDVTVLSRLGEPYYSTGPRDRRRGESQHMGLGIFIARTLLAHFGAGIEFSNEISGGAVVEIRWPRQQLEVRAEPVAGIERPRD